MIEKFDNIFLTNKGPIGKKMQNWIFKYSISFFQGLIEFIEGLIPIKIDF